MSFLTSSKLLSVQKHATRHKSSNADILFSNLVVFMNVSIGIKLRAT